MESKIRSFLIKQLSSIIFFFAFVPSAFCNSDSTFTFNHFHLRAPKTWHRVATLGVDSYVGRITNDVDTLEFDYGIYSLKPNRAGYQCKIRFALIGGKIARIARQAKPNKGMTAIYFKLSNDNRFVLYGMNLKDEKTALRIMRSVRFTK